MYDDEDVKPFDGFSLSQLEPDWSAGDPPPGTTPEGEREKERRVDNTQI